jgi:hypothetical protein
MLDIKRKSHFIQIINYGCSPFKLYKNQHIGTIQSLGMIGMTVTIELSEEDIIRQIDFNFLDGQENIVAKSFLKEFSDIFARNPK